jgi:hypothetical protein
VDVGDDTTTGDGGLDEGVELLVTTDGELEMAGRDTLDLEVLAGVAGKLEYLGGQVLKDGSSVDGGGGTDTLGLLDGRLEETVDTTDGELSCLGARFVLEKIDGERTKEGRWDAKHEDADTKASTVAHCWVSMPWTGRGSIKIQDVLEIDANVQIWNGFFFN